MYQNEMRIVNEGLEAGNFLCPFCNTSVSISEDTFRYFRTVENGFTDHEYKISADKRIIFLLYFICNNCNKISLKAKGINGEFEGMKWNLYPQFSYKILPDYVPSTIKSDYEEACKIVNLSPKASATLSRRCVQNIIRNFYEITKNTLYQEIVELVEYSNLDSTVIKALQHLRRIGNIGAHPEKDVNMIIDIEPNEAKMLINLIEIFIDNTYIKRFNEEKLFDDIENMVVEKEK